MPYNPDKSEKKVFLHWQHCNAFFQPPNSATITMPPPNITGRLHIGHSLMLSIQDSIVRYSRMRGIPMRYLPGTDHAGIATQAVLERTQEITPENRNEKAAQWRTKLESAIYGQIKRMGVACEYESARFTMDPDYCKAVNFAFLELARKNKILRSKRMVNWSGKIQSVLSDLEVDLVDVNNSKLEVDGKKYTFGKMYFFKYPIFKKSELKNVLQKIRDEIIKINKNDGLDNHSQENNEDSRENKKCDRNLKQTDNLEQTDNLKENNKVEQNNKIEQNDILEQNNNLNNNLIAVLEKLNIDDQIKDCHLFERPDCPQPLFFNILNHESFLTTPLPKKTYEKDFLKNLFAVFDTIEVATTRPETILGDTAVCVSRDCGDCLAVNPLTLNVIPVIFDSAADPTLGTGSLKVTPSCDPTDYDLKKKHGLKIVEIFDRKNVVRSDVGVDLEKFNDLQNFDFRRFNFRIETLKFLKKVNLFVKEENYKTTVPVCSRTGDIVEPVLRMQWWVDCKEMAKKARESGIEFYPKEAKKKWSVWMENVNDWCLSRQLWWGHRIPAYFLEFTCIDENNDCIDNCIDNCIDKNSYMNCDKNKNSDSSSLDKNVYCSSLDKNCKGDDCNDCICDKNNSLSDENKNCVGKNNRNENNNCLSNNQLDNNINYKLDNNNINNKLDNNDKNTSTTNEYGVLLKTEEGIWVIAESFELAQKCASKFFSKKFKLTQDNDVLDTWFSSSLWPMALQGYPHTKDFEPTEILETGSDILFFWVARMAMMCTFLCDKIPFKKVLLHGIVRDRENRKMSKSLGNVVDPMDVIDGVELETLLERICESKSVKSNCDDNKNQNESLDENSKNENKSLDENSKNEKKSLDGNSKTENKSLDENLEVNKKLENNSKNENKLENNLEVNKKLENNSENKNKFEKKNFKRSIKKDVEKSKNAMIETTKRWYPQGIKKSGADALRFALLNNVSGLKDVCLDLKRVEGYRKMCNKIYNAYLFLELQRQKYENGNKIDGDRRLGDFRNSEIGLFFLKKRNSALKNYFECMKKYDFMGATNSVYEFFYFFCDTMIEIEKSGKTGIIDSGFDDCLKMLHPFMPFVTEFVYQCKCGIFNAEDDEIKKIDDFSAAPLLIKERISKIILGPCCYNSDLGDDYELGKICPECNVSVFENYFNLAVHLRSVVKENFVLKIDLFGEEIMCLVRNCRSVEVLDGDGDVFCGIEYGIRVLSG